MTEDMDIKDDDMQPLEVDTAEGDDAEIEIEVRDDVAPQDKPRRAAAEDDDADDDTPPSEEELASYSKRVRKRIDKLTFAANEERRQRQEAERIREEALRYAEAVKREAEALRQQAVSGQAAVVEQAKARTAAQLEQAKRDYRTAYEAGDADGLIEAQAKLTRLSMEAAQLESYRPPAPQAAAPTASPAAPRAAAPAVPEPSPQAKAWAERNTWFRQNEEMTGYAFGVHERLVRSGVVPDSEMYYKELDASIRARFPEAFGRAGQEQRTQPRQTGTVVAPAGRTAKASRRVVLTPSQVAVAARLGLTPQQYAAQLAKE